MNVALKTRMKISKKKSVMLILIFACILSVNAQDITDTFTNPILSGYHPDPSICRVGDDYYMVTSTFIWYPGIPIYHSKDLVNWELIGHGINRPNQLGFDSLKDREGVYAVTIRHHNGVFYLITTCVACNNNFYLTATDPAGPWSDPVWLNDAPGIDPSLFWDKDGKCYYTGHTWIMEQNWPNQCGIWTQELDLEKQKLVGKREIFTYGHAINASYTEGPHLYQINGKYMLMVSEGGTGMYHSLSVHHSDSLWGPYVADMINPVLTHRYLGENYPIQAVGHGDLVQTQNGEWWCVSLGKRRINGETLLARETFLTRVKFEGQTPVFNPGEGKVLEKLKRPDLPWTPFSQEPVRDNFNNGKLGLKWCTIRIPKEPFYSLEENQIKIQLRPEVLDSLVHSSLLIQRIKDYKFVANTKLSFKTFAKNEQAGIAIYRTNENYYLLLKEKKSLVLIKSFKGIKEEVLRVPYLKKEVFLRAEGNGLDVNFSYGEIADTFRQIGGTQSMIVVADGNGNQFNGPGVGMYATSNGKKSKAKAVFDWFEYKSEK